MDPLRAIGRRDVWSVIRASAEKRLGKPLLKAYLFLALFGLLAVGVCVLILHL